jgi:hypothetical protein
LEPLPSSNATSSVSAPWPDWKAARARGRLGGRPVTMTPEKLAVARQMYQSRQHTSLLSPGRSRSAGPRSTGI